MPTVIFTRVIGLMTKQMVLVSSLTLKMPNMKATGRMISSMAKEPKFGTTVLLDILVISIRARNKVKADLNGKMAATTKVISFKVSSKVSESTTLLT